MQIILRQKDIEAALKHYIVQQGISLSGKTVAISFTAGRKDTGLSAELAIEESEESLNAALEKAEAVVAAAKPAPTPVAVAAPVVVPAPTPVPDPVAEAAAVAALPSFNPFAEPEAPTAATAVTLVEDDGEGKVNILAQAIEEGEEEVFVPAPVKTVSLFA